MNIVADVGIVIPTYNQADFLREALRSVIAQDHQNWHVIIVNNLSTDHTHDVVREFADSRIDIIDFANHGVIAASRNLAIHKSATKYLAFLDSDDWWQPQKLSRCIHQLERGADLVCHAEEWKSATSSRVVRYGPQARTEYRALLLGGNCLSTSAIVGRTEMFKAVDCFSERPDFITAEDYDLWLRLAQRGYRIALIDDVLGTFRIHSASASSSIARNSAAEMAVVNSHLAMAEFSRRVVRQRMGQSHYAAARAFHKANDFVSARRHFLTALRLAPLFPRTYVGLLLNLFIALRRGAAS